MSPRAACAICGAPSLPGKSRCGLHPRAATPAQKRAYRGTAAYRRVRRDVIARDAGICHLCGGPGADEIDHIVPYADQDPRTRDDLDASQFLAAHRSCNARRGRRPLT